MGAIAVTGAMKTIHVIGGDMCRQTSHKATSKIGTIATRRMTTLIQSHVDAKAANMSNIIRNRYMSAVTRTRTNLNAAKKNPLNASESRNASADASANLKQAQPESGSGFVQWYEGHLASRPVATKAVSGSILWGLGDLVAQVLPTLMDDSASESDDVNEKEENKFQYDFPRTARAVFFGFAIHAPLSHVHFNFLEWMTVRGGFQGLAAPVFKTVMEQFVYWSWISNSLYHGAMGAMQGKNFQQIQDRIEDVLMDTQIAQWKFWIPVQLLNFKFVPVRHQLNVVLVTSIVWTALLSAWYPPEENESEDAKGGEVAEKKKE